MKNLFSLLATALLLIASSRLIAADPNQLPYESYKIAATRAGKDQFPEQKELRINALNSKDETIEVSLHLGLQEPDLTSPLTTLPYTFNFLNDHAEQLQVDAIAGFSFDSITFPIGLNCRSMQGPPNSSSTVMAIDQNGLGYKKSRDGHLALCQNAQNSWQFYPIAQGYELFCFSTFANGILKNVNVMIHVLPPVHPKASAPVSP